MHRRMRVIGFAVALLIVGLMSAEAQFGGRRGGGGRGGGRGGDMGIPEEMRDRMEALRAFPVEAIWTGLSFGVDLPDSQLIMIKPVIADAWAKRNGILEIAKKDNTWKQAKEVLEDLKKDVDKKLEVILTKDQRKKLKKLVKSQDNAAGFPGR